MSHLFALDLHRNIFNLNKILRKIVFYIMSWDIYQIKANQPVFSAFSSNTSVDIATSPTCRTVPPSTCATDMLID